MQAFVVRPFGTRGGIDFDGVHNALIGPALKTAEISGGTTGLIVNAGNIRDDMFQLLLLADLVIADISIHNANVFYELGVRHALRSRQTFLIRAKVAKPRAERAAEDEVPFDLKTDRYLEYDPANPAAALDELVRGLKDTRNTLAADSPIFRSLPKLIEPSRIQLTPVPLYFGDDVQHAADANETGKLALLGWEAKGYLWEAGALRMVGRELVKCKAWDCARYVWEAVRANEPNDFEANRLLGTVYQKLGNISQSESCLERALANTNALPEERAEALALRGSNEKTRARLAWDGLAGQARAVSAIQSGALQLACNYYRQGFELSLNHYYSGLNALSLYTLLLQLVQENEDAWMATFPADEDATAARKRMTEERAELAAAVGLALKSAGARLQPGTKDDWLDIARADYAFLTGKRDAVTLYKRAVAKLSLFSKATARAQLELFESFGFCPEQVNACLAAFPAAGAADASIRHAILFTGHMIDAPGRSEPRFPARAEGAARTAILAAVQRAIDATPGCTVGIAGGASGGDILFHEVCAELGIETRLRLTLPENLFVARSVAPAGGDWVKRFNALTGRLGKDRIQVLGETEELPRWMKSSSDYDVWQRTNMWILQDAIATAPERSLIALWDGKAGDGPGGTQHLVETAPQFGVAVAEVISTVGLGS